MVWSEELEGEFVCNVFTPTRNARGFKHTSQWQGTHKYSSHRLLSPPRRDRSIWGLLSGWT